MFTHWYYNRKGFPSQNFYSQLDKLGFVAPLSLIFEDIGTKEVIIIINNLLFC